MRKVLLVVLLLTSVPRAPLFADAPATTRSTTSSSSFSFTRQEDVVYGRSYGAALTVDVFKPTTAKQNGAGVILVVSGGWVSAHELLASPFFKLFVDPFTQRGYVVFAVCHACQPKFQVPEIVGNINRAVRFIRYHAKDYGVDPQRLGITGGSAGGHLSLMQGFNPQPPKGDAPDPVDRTSSQVQAVACFFPPTDFLNYGKKGVNFLDEPKLATFRAPFDFHELDPKTGIFVRVEQRSRIEELEKSVSPIYFITKDDPPTLIAHGDADVLVPLEQSQRVIDKLKDLGVPAELIIKKGANHGWADANVELEKFADWFDKYLPVEAHDEAKGGR